MFSALSESFMFLGNLWACSVQYPRKPSLGGGVWADGTIYAVGDCNYGCIGEPGKWEMPPVPKISYPGEEQAYHACLNVMKMENGQKNKLLGPEDGER